MRNLKFAYWPWKQCSARIEPNRSGFWGRCELEKDHEGDHCLERGFYYLYWSTKWYLNG